MVLSSDNNYSADEKENIIETFSNKKLKTNDCVYSSFSTRQNLLIQEFKKIVDKVYQESLKGIKIFGLDVSIYGFHRMIHELITNLYNMKLYIFYDKSFLINSSTNLCLEEELGYLLECAHSKHVCNLFYFINGEHKQIIMENLAYIHSLDFLQALKEIKQEYQSCVLKSYIFNIVCEQMCSFVQSYKSEHCETSSYFKSNLQVVGYAKDLLDLKKYFIKELQALCTQSENNNFEGLKDLLKTLIEMKIKILQDNEMCLMLKIYCSYSNEFISFLKHKKNLEIFYGMINLFNKHRSSICVGENLEYFQKICENYENKKKFIFIDENIKKKIELLNDIEIDLLSEAIKKEIQSADNSFYNSISPLGNYVSDMINREVYNLITNKVA